VVIGVGRFGPYVRHNSKFTSLKKEDDPLSITLERSIELIEEGRKRERERLVKAFESEPELQILNGRWGPIHQVQGR
jgi:DNA topoisomerase I